MIQLLAVIIIGSSFAIWVGVKTASVQAKVYNEQYGTSFTTSDFFWAQDQINTQTQTIKLK